MTSLTGHDAEVFSEFVRDCRRTGTTEVFALVLDLLEAAAAGDDQRVATLRADILGRGWRFAALSWLSFFVRVGRLWYKQRGERVPAVVRSLGDGLDGSGP